MSIFEKLEQVRNKPVETKRRILFLSLAVSMIVVIALWVSILRLAPDEEKTEKNAGPSPWKVLKNTFDTSKIQFKKSLPGEIYKRE